MAIAMALAMAIAIRRPPRLGTSPTRGRPRCALVLDLLSALLVLEVVVDDHPSGRRLRAARAGVPCAVPRATVDERLDPVHVDVCLSYHDGWPNHPVGE